MPEQTLALKLNGAEIRKVLLEKIDQALSRDWSMNPATSYDFFEGKITVSISLHDTGHEYPLDVSVGMQQGLEPAEAETQTVITECSLSTRTYSAFNSPRSTQLAIVSVTEVEGVIG